MTFTEIRLRLNELGLRPSRRLGQNFLHDQNVAQRIVELALIQPGESVLEIGPGLGALTEFIVKREPDLTLIEKDRRLADFLHSHYPRARIIEGDALQEISNLKFQISNCVCLGNLPYSIASPLIVRLCEVDLRPSRMVFTVQREVAQRLTAGPCTSNYGLLTLLTQPFYDIKIARQVSPTVFWPQPEVFSAVVRMTRRAVSSFGNADQECRFRKLVATAFQKRRKTLGTIFRMELPGGVARDRRRAGEAIAPLERRRPEELTISEWMGFANQYKSNSAFSVPPSALKEEVFDVVNPRDEVVGQERRKEVHRKSLLHRAIHIFIWNGHGELLLQKRSLQKDQAAGLWDSSVAGHLGAGEAYDDAARRELVEELGVTLPLRRARKFSACGGLGWEFVWLYEGNSEGPFFFPPDEISAVRWWKREGIDVALRDQPDSFAPSFRHIWEHWK